MINNMKTTLIPAVFIGCFLGIPHAIASSAAYPCGEFNLSTFNNDGYGIKWASGPWGREKGKTIIKPKNQTAQVGAPYCFGLIQPKGKPVELWSFSSKAKDFKKVADLPYSKVEHRTSLRDLLVASRPAADGQGYDVALISAMTGKTLLTLSNIADIPPSNDGSKQKKNNQPFFNYGGYDGYIYVEGEQGGQSAYGWIHFYYANGERGLLGLIRPQGSAYVSKIIDFKNDAASPGDFILLSGTLQIKLGNQGYFDVLKGGRSIPQGYGFSKIRLFDDGLPIGDVGEEFDATLFTQKPVDIQRLNKIIEDYKSSSKRALMRQTSQGEQWYVMPYTEYLGPVSYKNVWNKPHDGDLYVQLTDGSWSQYRYPQFRASSLEEISKDKNIKDKIAAVEKARSERSRAEAIQRINQQKQLEEEAKRRRDQLAREEKEKQNALANRREANRTGTPSTGAPRLSNLEKDYYDNIGNSRNPYEIIEKK